MIIKCPECGHQVSDKAPVCPSCGVEISGHIIKCPNCGEIYLKEDITCPNCHFTPNIDDSQKNKQTITTNVENTNADEDSEKQIAEGEEPIIVASPIKDEYIKENKIKKNSHLPLLVSVLLAVLTAALFLYLYYDKGNTDNEMENYRTALTSNDIGIMKSYLADNVNAPIDHIKEITTLLKKMQKANDEWSRVLQANNVQEYKKYLDSNPNSPYKSEIINRIDNLLWSEALRVNNESSYLGYKEKMPNGKHNKEADEKLKVLLDNTSTPEEQKKAENLIRDFLIGINSKNIDKIAYTVPSTFSFLGKTGSTVKDVATYMRDKLYQADVKTLNWHIGTTKLSTTDKTDDGQKLQTIEVLASLVIDREGGKSTKNYTINAKIKNNKIVEITWI